MRIACPDGGQGLNDDGDGDIKTIESRLNAFRYSETIKTLSASDTSYQKMVKQIDKYWGKLFADPIQVDTPCRYGNCSATTDQQSDGAVVSFS